VSVGVSMLAQGGLTQKCKTSCVPLVQGLAGYNLLLHLFVVLKTMQLLSCCNVSKRFWVLRFDLSY
jgi:hypothetical protein